MDNCNIIVLNRLRSICIKSRIIKLREEYGYTQAQLAQMAGVSRQTIISIESDKYNPSLNLAFKIAEIFNRKVEDVFIYEKD